MRIRELDSLRGLASLGVVLFHYSIVFGVRPAEGLLLPFYNYGFFLVDFFFVLSGYVLCHAYDTEKKRGALRTNFVKRVARIYPLHFATLLLSLGLYLVFYHGFGNQDFFQRGNDAYHFLLNLTLTHRVGFQTQESFNVPSWSISTEFWVSIVFFVIIAKLRRTTPVFVALIVFSAAMLVAADNETLAVGQDLYFTDVCLMRNTLGFCIGTILFKVCRTGRKSSLADVLLVTLAGLFLWLTAASDASMKTVFFVCTGVIFPAVVASTLYSRHLRALLNLRPFTFLGDISYSTYLIHAPLLWLLKGTVDALGIGIDFGQSYVLVGYLAVLVGLSAVCFTRLELPAQRWINERGAR